MAKLNQGKVGGGMKPTKAVTRGRAKTTKKVTRRSSKPKKVRTRENAKPTRLGTRGGTKLTHVDARGRAKMVDVGGKPETARRAEARGRVTLSAEAFRLVKENRVAKGDVLAVARIAGIQGAKRASDLIPLCHPIPLDTVSVELTLDARRRSVVIRAEAATRSATGVEMEAMTAVAVAALAVYDMCKGVDRGITIGGIDLLSKSGGRSGNWKRPKTTRASAARPRHA